MSESRIAPEHASAGRPLIHLSELLRAPVVARSGETVGRVEDVIVRLRGADTYPLVTGIVAGVGTTDEDCVVVVRVSSWTVAAHASVR